MGKTAKDEQTFEPTPPTDFLKITLHVYYDEKNVLNFCFDYF